jgi:hypothetical protein
MESNLHDWQSDRSMDYHKAKPHQKQEQFKKLPYKVNNPHQKPKDKWVQEELHFNDKPWRETPLTDTEIETLFWTKLVVLGWRIETYGGEKTTRKNLVLPCPYCNNKLETVVWEFINSTNAKKMSDAKDVKKRIESHSSESSMCAFNSQEQSEA